MPREIKDLLAPTDFVAGYISTWNQVQYKDMWDFALAFGT